MSSPFIYEDPLGSLDHLADRYAELELLKDRILQTRNSRLEGPRRFGKTSLLKAALDQAKQNEFIPVYVNFLGVLTVADVADRIERAYREQLKGSLKRWFSGAISAWNPKVKAAPAGFGIELEPHEQASSLLDRLALPHQLNERHNRCCAIAFDEFQDVIRLGSGVTGTIRSELEQHRSAAAYIFSGSHPGLMRDLFADRRHAFFAQAKAIPVGPLPANDLADYIGKRFEENSRQTGEALEPLLNLAQGHPQRSMLLAHHLYEHTPKGSSATTTTWLQARTSALQEAAGEIQTEWANFTTSERRLISVIATETTPLQGRVAQQRYGVTRSGGNQKTIEQLERNGYIMASEQTASRWKVVDPLLAFWLAHGRSFPGRKEIMY